MIRYEILGSGSKGNGLLINDELLIDCGVPYNLIVPYIKGLKYILVTHAHGDHYNPSTLNKIKYERPLVQVLVNEAINTDALKFEVHTLQPHQKMLLGSYVVHPVPLYHNIPNLGFVIKYKDVKFFYGTDTYEVSHITEAKALDFYFLEMNFDEEIMEIVVEREVNSSRSGFSHYEESQFNHLSFQKAWNWFCENRSDESRLIPLHVSSNLIGSLIEFLEKHDPNLIFLKEN